MAGPDGRLYDVVDGNQTQGVRLLCFSMSGTIGGVNPPHVQLHEQLIRRLPRHGSTVEGATGAQSGGAAKETSAQKTTRVVYVVYQGQPARSPFTAATTHRPQLYIVLLQLLYGVKRQK